ncbi:helix-turn-helix domain-containing protein [Actinomadura sp. 9N407]|uniref:helix-turn-helix domain-containing protein n=1 Tax=Actinomadura sp. 9N407 TaxID=3375154 RepID=UPI0037BD60C3
MAEPPPSTARLRKIGRTLRQIREDAGHTLKYAGRLIERSDSSLSLIEKGTQQLRLRDLKHILDVYGVGPDVHHALMTLAEQQQQSGWWEDFKHTVSPAALDHASLESSASTIDLSETSLIPGLLQTEDYARSVIRAGLIGDQLARTDRLVAYRMARQQALKSGHLLRLKVTIDEAALRRIRGGRQVMRAQLGKIVEEADRDNIKVHVLPFACEIDPSYIGSFQIISISRPAILSVVLMDHLTGRWILEEKSDVASYHEKFTHVVNTALDETRSRALIQGIASEL